MSTGPIMRGSTRSGLGNTRMEIAMIMKSCPRILQSPARVHPFSSARSAVHEAVRRRGSETAADQFLRGIRRRPPGLLSHVQDLDDGFFDALDARECAAMGLVLQFHAEGVDDASGAGDVVR